MNYLLEHIRLDDTVNGLLAEDSHKISSVISIVLINKNFGHKIMNIIRIYHECKGGIEKSVPRITVWHHKACRVMKIVDPEGRIFLSHSHMNDGFFLAHH